MIYLNHHLYFWIGIILLLDSTIAVAQSAMEVDLYGGSLPDGAVARIQSGRLRQQATGEIFEIAISPSGNLLAASSYQQGGITLWDPATGEQVALNQRMDGQGPFVFSLDGKRLAARGRNERGALVVFDPATGQELLRYRPLRDSGIGAFNYQPFTLTPDGRFLLVAVKKEIHFINVANGKLERTIEIGDVAHRVLVAPNGAALAIGCADKSVRLWDIAGDKELHRLRDHAGNIGAMTFTRDSKTLLTGDNVGSVYIWDAGSGKRLDILKTDVSSVQAMAVSGDAKYLVLGGQGLSVVLWDLPGRKVLARTPPHYAPTWSIAITTDGNRIAWGDQSSYVRMAEIVDNKLRLITPGKLLTRDLAFSGDGNAIITVGDGAFHVWESATGKEMRRAREQGFEVRALTHAPVLNRFALACSDGTVRLREEVGGKDVLKLSGEDRSLHAVSISADGKWLIATGAAQVHVWNTASGKQVHKLGGHRGSVTAVAVSPDGSFLASASEDHTVRVWDRNAGAELRQFAEHRSPVTCVAIAPNGKLAASGSWDGVVRLWDPTTARQVARLDAHRDNVSAVAFAPAGDRIATAGWDGVIRLWDYTGKEVARFEGHKDEISALTFAPDSKRLASASRDHTVLVWQLPGQ